MKAIAYVSTGLAAGAVLAGTVVAVAGPKSAPRADVSATNELITACVAKKSGAVRFVSAAGKCRKKQKVVTFNSTGPRGPAGEPGPRGAQGDPGPSKVIVAANASPVPIGILDANVVSIDVPAGSYNLDATVSVSNGGKDTSYRCDITAGAGSLLALPVKHAGNSATHTTSGTLVTPVATQVFLVCGSSYSPVGDADAVLRATKVGEVVVGPGS